jgi:hypothetical protein
MEKLLETGKQSLFTPSEQPRRQCSHCGEEKETMFKCSKCASAYYCNAEHQKLDYKKHKQVCSVAKSIEVPKELPKESTKTPVELGKNCSYCGETQETMFKCSKCASAYYCNAEHQKLDFKKHKQLCRSPESIPGETKKVQTLIVDKNNLQEAIVSNREKLMKLAEEQYPKIPSKDNNSSSMPNKTLEKKCEAPGCDQYTSQVCSKCREITICSAKCMASIWPTHKLKCEKASLASKEPISKSSERSMENQPVSIEISGNMMTFLEELQKKRALICEKYGIPKDTVIGTDVNKETKLQKGGTKAEFFAEMLALFDSGNENYQRQGTIQEAYHLNRRYNNTYSQATLVLTPKELDSLHGLMRSRRIGNTYRNL